MTVLLVHPHPDDEALLTGGVILRVRARGGRVVLATATRGEEGGGHDPQRLAEVRTEELRVACSVLDVDRQVFLGFRDSGLRPDGASGPRAFSRVPLAEAAAPIARLLREERPDLVVTAAPDGTYGHPDHVRAHDATLAALDELRTEGWYPRRLAMVVFPRGAGELVVHGLLAWGRLPSAWLRREASRRRLPGTRMRVLPLGPLFSTKQTAILAHRSQLRGATGLVVRVTPLCRLVFGAEWYEVADDPASAEASREGLFAHV